MTQIERNLVEQALELLDDAWDFVGEDARQEISAAADLLEDALSSEDAE